MTDPIIPQLKAGIRCEMRARMASVEPGAMAGLSRQACELMLQQSVWQEAQTVMLFSPLPDEIDVSLVIRAALSAEKTVCLPRFNKERSQYEAAAIQNLTSDLSPGKMGIAEPSRSCRSIPLNLLDFCLASGVAFDVGGRRLGRGWGYYDRIFDAMKGIKCGAAWDEQILTSIPVEPHDQLLDLILTPTRWIVAGAKSA
jgi:5-formyltetrahydrofolate cyclo-ligase